jgi:hypothetical protein
VALRGLDLELARAPHPLIESATRLRRAAAR